MNAQSIPPIVMASITFVVGAFVLYLYRKRRRPEDLSFAGMCLAVVAYDIAAAGSYNAAAPDETLPWQRLQVVAIASVGVPLMRFVTDYTRQPRPWWGRVFSAYFGLAALVTACERSDLTLRVAAPSIKHVFLPLGFGVTYRELSPGVLVLVHGVIGTAAFLLLVLVSFRALRTGQARRAKPLLWALGLFSVAFVNDVCVHLGLYSSIYLMEYGYLGLVLVVVSAIAAELVEAGVLKAEREVLEEQLRQAAKMEAVGRLAGGVAHDLNNQLTPILGYSEVALGRRPLSDEMRMFFEQIHDAAEHARELTRQLLALGRKQVPRKTSIDLNPIVSGSRMMLGRVIPENIEVKLSLEPRLGTVHGDVTQLRQILFNLVLNARDAMPDGGRLEISTFNSDLVRDTGESGLRPGSYVVLAVRDSGIGMDEETRSKIFDPFFTTKQQYQNTGLGLSTVAGIVKQHGGETRVQSAPGRGALFEVFLPRVSSQPEIVKPQQEVGPAVHEGALILVVEDEAAVRRLAQKVLVDRGYAVLVAESPGAAEKLAREHGHRLRLLVTDLVMPKMNGAELHRKLLESWPGLPALFMSGYPDRVLEKNGSVLPPGPFLAKPFTASELVQAVEATLVTTGPGPRSHTRKAPEEPEP